jgi:hypothetical protein
MHLPRTLLILAALASMAAAPPRHPPPGTPVTLQAQPGTPLDRAARELVADDLAASVRHGDNPLLLVGTARLGGDRPALFVQLQSPRQCGSAGCDTSVYAYVGGGWRRVLDGVSGRLTVASTKTHGWSDLLTDEDHYVWTGTAYRSIRPAPALDLRPRVRRHSAH